MRQDPCESRLFGAAWRLAKGLGLGAILLSCNGREPTPPPPPPPTDRSTLLVENQSGRVVDFAARCCGDARFDQTMAPGDQICLIMTGVTSTVWIEARTIDNAYVQADSLPNPSSNPAWTWVLLSADAQLRAATVPCG